METAKIYGSIGLLSIWGFYFSVAEVRFHWRMNRVVSEYAQWIVIMFHFFSIFLLLALDKKNTIVHESL